MLSLGGLIAFLIQPMNWQWVFNFEQSYILCLCWHSLLFTVFLLAAVETVHTSNPQISTSR